MLKDSKLNASGSHRWPGIFFAPSLEKFHGPASVVLSGDKTYLRLAPVSKNLKQSTWPGIFFAPSLEKFHGPASVVLSGDKTYLRLAPVSKNLKQFRFFYRVRPVGIGPTTFRLRGDCSTS